MKTLAFDCDDRYEAEKLTSLLSVQKDGTVWLSGIAAVIGKEIVFQLRDRSSHSVVLKSSREAESLKIFLSEVLAGRAVILSSACEGSTAEIKVD